MGKLIKWGLGGMFVIAVVINVMTPPEQKAQYEQNRIADEKKDAADAACRADVKCNQKRIDDAVERQNYKALQHARRESWQ